MYATRVTSWLLFIAFLAFSIPTGAECPEDNFACANFIGEREQWSATTDVTRAERFFISGQPDGEALEHARDSGIDIVINLRGASESDWDEAAVISELGLEYHQIPVNGAAENLASEPFSEISEIVLSNPDAEILVHCSSGNRASAWYATHLALVEGMDTEEAILMAKRTGLDRQGLEDKVRAFLRTKN